MSRAARTLTGALTAALCCLCLAPARGQQSPTPATTPAPPPVRVSLLVRDKEGRPVSGARREELRVTVGGVEQAVSALTVDESPLSYGLVVDNSASLKELIGAAVASAKLVVLSNRPSDEGFVVRFVGSERITLMQDFTNERALLDRALDGMYIEGGQTALVDALHLAAEHFKAKGKGTAAGPRRRALVLITDGEDRASFYTPDQLVKRLKEEDIRVFCVGLTGNLERQGGVITLSRRERAEAFLTRLAKETGGRAFFVEKVGELRDAAEQIVEHLRAGYVVEFSPAGKGGGPASGKLEIKPSEATKNGRVVIHQPLTLKDGGVKRK